MSNNAKGVLSRLNEHNRELVRGSFMGLASRATAALIVFLFNVLLARTLGADQAGIYFLSIAIITGIAVCSRLGLDNAIIRFSSTHYSRGEWGDVAALYRRSSTVVLLTSTVLAIALYLSADSIASGIFSKPELSQALKYLAFGLPCIALIPLHSRFLQSTKRVAIALYTQNALIPTILLIALLVIPVDWRIDDIMAGYALAALLGLIICMFFWLRNSPIWGAGIPDYDFSRLAASSRNLFPANVVNKVVQPWAPIIFLGYWGSIAEVGWFGAAARVAALIAFAIVPVNTILAPKMAVMAADNQYRSLFLLARNATGLIIVIAVPAVGGILLFPDRIMSIFGDDFIGAGSILLVLAFGQVINVLSGPVQSMLVMTGNESAHKIASLAGGGVTLLLCVILIPKFGGMGAAWTSACGYAATNIFSSIMVWMLLWTRTRGTSTEA